MISFKKKLVAVAAAMAVTTSAIAITPVIDSAVLTASHTLNATVTAFATSMSAMIQTQIVPALASVADVVSQTQIEQTKVMLDANNKAHSAAEQARAVTRYQLTDPCAVGASSQGVAEALRNGAAIGSGAGGGGRGAVSGGGGGTGRAGNALGRSLAIAEGKADAPSPEAAAMLGAAAACSGFADGSRAKECGLARMSTGVSTGYSNADIRAATIIDGPQKAGSSVKRLTVDIAPNSPEELAIASYRKNLFTPVPLRTLNQGELDSDAGKRYLGLRDAYDARMSMAEHPSERHAGMTRANKATLPVLRELLSSPTEGAYVLAYLNANVPNWQSTGISADELANLEVERRYSNLAWLKKTVTMSPEEVQREQLRLIAFQGMLLNRLTQEVRENSLVSGSMLASLVRTESLAELKAAHAKAAR